MRAKLKAPSRLAALAALLLGLAAGALPAEAAVPASPVPAATALAATAKPPEVAVGGRIERAATSAALGIAGTPNPYDPDEVRVDAELVFPDGAKRLQPCFWYVPCAAYQVEAPGDDPRQLCRWERFRPAGAGEWRLRFSPPVPGKYTWTYAVTVAGKSWTKPGGAFAVRAAPPPGARPVGPLRRGPDARYFADAAGRTFVPIGHNLGWPDESGSAGYAGWLRELAAAGGNATRLWLVHYYGGTALEWSSSEHNSGYAGVGRYSQEAAWRVDRILAAAEAEGVQVMLCFFSFGDQNWDWPTNPYNRAAGGWLAAPAEFFTDARARAAVRKLLRYAVARWGASPNVWAWELWNEVETSRGYVEESVTAWHREMAAELKRLDVHGHLVTTSYRFPPPSTPDAAFGLPEIDFAQVHMYGPRLLSGLDGDVRAVWKFGKPVVVGEYGLWVSPNYFEADPAGLHLHDGAWAGIFTGAAGSGMSWWWERYIHPRGLCFHYTGLARFLKDAELAGARPATGLVLREPEKYFACALRTAAGVLGWVGLVREAGWEGADETLRLTRYACATEGGPVEFRLEGDFRGAYEILFYDTFDGLVVGRTTATSAGRDLDFTLPAFRHDLAFSCRPAGAASVAPSPAAPATPLHDQFVKLQAEALAAAARAAAPTATAVAPEASPSPTP